MLSVAPKQGPDGQLLLHASTVTINGRAVLFAGPSGVGKSSHALALMSLGATLLADDITWITRAPAGLMAQCPPALSGKIEARGVGILNAVPAAPTQIGLIVDLGTPETERLPSHREITLLDRQIAVLHNSETPYFKDAVLQYMLHGRFK